MPEIRPGVFKAVFAQVTRAGDGAVRAGLIIVADALVKQAKSNASNGSHPWGTPTPARPGEGPAKISGTLVRSLTRQRVMAWPGGWETKVGVRPGQVPPYGKTPSSKYALFLETGLRNGSTYPFLKPATAMFHIQADVAFAKTFSAAKWSI